MTEPEKTADDAADKFLAKRIAEAAAKHNPLAPTPTAPALAIPFNKDHEFLDAEFVAEDFLEQRNARAARKRNPLNP